jgi:hypothetical protein
MFLLLSGATVQAQPRSPIYGEPNDFYGTWHNVEVQKNVVVRIEIHPENNHRVRVTVFGLRNGEPCVYGEYRGHFFFAKYPKDREQDNSAILVKVEKEFAHGHVLLRFNVRGEIVSHALIETAEGGPVYNVERFAVAGRRSNEESYPPREAYPPREGYPYRDRGGY